MKIQSGEEEDVRIVITDIVGEKVYEATGPANQNYFYGKNFIRHIYQVYILLDVNQGKNVQKLKLIEVI